MSSGEELIPKLQFLDTNKFERWGYPLTENDCYACHLGYSHFKEFSVAHAVIMIVASQCLISKSQGTVSLDWLCIAFKIIEVVHSSSPSITISLFLPPCF